MCDFPLRLLYIDGCWLCSTFHGQQPPYSLLSRQGLHPVHLCAQQNRPNLHRGAWHHLQGAPLRTHLCPPPLELWWPAGEDVGLPAACAHVRVIYTVTTRGCERRGKTVQNRETVWIILLVQSGEFDWDHVFFCSYTKPKGQLPDYTSPVVLPDGRTSVEDFCLKIHKNLIKELK